MKDVIIIGAGIVGSNVARELSKYKLDIILIEKNIEVGAETTKANSAIVHAGYDATPGTLKAKLNVRGSELFESLAEELDIPYNKCGSFVLAFNDDELETIKKLKENGIKSGVKNMEILSFDEVKKLEPNIGSTVKGALYAKDAAIVCPFITTHACVQNAVINGVDFKRDEEVIGIEKEDSYYIVKTKKGEYKTRYVINCAGLYSDKISGMMGEASYEILPHKGEYHIFDKSEFDKVHSVIFKSPANGTKGVLVTPTVHGNLIMGPTKTFCDREDTSTNVEALAEVDRLGKQMVEGISFQKSIRLFSGVRASTKERDFHIYEKEGYDNFIEVGGIDSPGLASSPAIAEYVAMILDKKEKLIKKADYKTGRPSIVDFSELDSDEQDKLIKKNPDYGKVICRCELVTKAEILDAIRTVAGARTVSGIKRLVRSGMGRCQGGFCEPEIVEILIEELGIDASEVMKDRPDSWMVLK